ncbi:TonB family C-terminal domain-containing protein [Mucilaginibacter lappiensis]|uniref:TonB family protein n=1 Tax=Mucilaginibacter lappiensis TaxID=354630 RepID=A0ABR6PFK1_9SPHI|nr:energy transducer TonB [Mucilaginibacter lappiensis]MBB6108545.1 TonB family protein [Mucilaginibacter lappiensis]SIQ33825.1 TonB family C-terminal domain-containing protein [Mucilaginibacter lappiensis]
MKKPALLLIFISLLSLHASAQTKQITNNDYALGIKERFYVLKSNKDFREGQYLAYNQTGNTIFCQGYYKNNQKDSLWTYYSFDAKVAAKGYYKENKKVGVWDAYNFKEELQVRYDYSTKQLILYKPNKNNSEDRQFNVINDKDTLNVQMDHSAVYLDGDGLMMKPAVFRSVKYPAAARERHIQGVVLIAVTIDTECKITNYRIKNSVGFGCDEEALRAVKQITGDWIPGVYQGKSVISEYDIPFSFTLAND